MFASLLNSLFGCAHQRTTFPITPRRGLGRTYVACLDCGQEFDYDWKSMQVGRPVPARVLVTSQPASLHN
jgi:hypothetical protein